ncbi:flagellar basal body-associated FliL family protein [Alcaligenaceae bacterium A4P071]|nr:flagellar basal body-associated FliL family protein [Alcaligenaceae bacterium B3P038]MDQ2149801.1 flagellar basal body-associated FliL family protein [Alcaligenaceae bacterium C4P045]MDQ2184132.1 flagellar basal body-associated FliL family protein [Alcaligenaceae bacterium A4P071]
MATSKPSAVPSRNSLPKNGKSSRLLRPILSLLVLLAVAGISVATTWLLTTRMQKNEASGLQLAVGDAQAASAPQARNEPVSAVVPAPIFLAIEPFTVTVNNDEMERMVHMAITLRIGDDLSRTQLEKYMPEVRNRILMLVSGQSPQAVQTPQGKRDLATAIQKSLSQPFTPNPDGQRISDVLFTAFVVQ